MVLRKALEEIRRSQRGVQRLLTQLARYYRRHWHRPEEFIAEDEPEPAGQE